MTAKLFADLAMHAAPAMRNLVSLTPPDRIDFPVSLEGFGPRELVCHVADNERLVLEWVQLAVEEPGRSIHVPDALELARLHDYKSQDVYEALDRFEASRSQVCDLIVSLSAEELDRHISCPFRGAVTVHDQCVFLLGHDVYHLDLLGRAARGLA